MSLSATTSPPHGLSGLAAIVGQEHTSLCGSSIRVAPADKQQISAVLRFAQAAGLTVSPLGSGSKLGWGHAVTPGILLSLERMAALREHAWADMTCTVEAGCCWAHLQRELSRHGQMVALDPLWPQRATVGGIVATNDSGSLRQRYGGLRDLILGMTLVLADGTLARTGGKVVKNVAGYDLHKLLTGSFGTLGVIAEVNFRLHPAETHRTTCTAIGAEAAVFTQPMRALLESELTLSGMQLRTTQGACALDVRLALPPECIEDAALRVQQILGPATIRTTDESVWQARQELFDTPESIVLKLATLPGETATLTAAVHQLAADRGIDIASVAQATGLITVALRSAPERAPEFLDRLRSLLAPSGGSVVALQLPDSLRGAVDVWGMRGDALPLMREIKRRFDPQGTLNPGRFVGNI